MEITGLNEYNHSTSSKKSSAKYNSDTDINMAVTFKNEVLNWEEKIKEKINKDLENDREKNIKMSEKQWHALMNKVDSAINANNQVVKSEVKVDYSKPNDEDKRLYDDFKNAGVDLVQNVENNSFAGILKEKEASKMSTKDFLSSLTPDELYVIQKANGLASQIKVNKLSDEGAENLFLKPLGDDKVVDLNNDGIEEIGEAKMVFFPPPNAPDSVKKAWEEGTNGLSPEEKDNIFFKIIAKQVESNYSVGPDGTFIKHKPGEAEWNNIFGNTEESYIDLFNSIIERIDNPLAATDSNHKKNDELAKKVLTDVINYIHKG